jgi:prevent-host-death family protein
MSLLVDSKPVSYLQAHVNELLAQINATHQPVAITENGETKAILQDPESYQSLQNVISLLKLISQAEEDIRLGRTLTQSELETEMLELLADPNNELFGVWSDRDDIDDVDGYVRTLRKGRFF